jgi:hypothetical protein
MGDQIMNLDGFYKQIRTDLDRIKYKSFTVNEGSNYRLYISFLKRNGTIYCFEVNTFGLEYFCITHIVRTVNNEKLDNDQRHMLDEETGVWYYVKAKGNTLWL